MLLISGLFWKRILTREPEIHGASQNTGWGGGRNDILVLSNF